MGMHIELERSELAPGDAVLRQAVCADIAGMHRVRLSVRENVLLSAIDEADYASSIEVTGRGWVIEVDGAIVAFAVGNAQDGNIWALFVAPEHERRGYGRRLHDVMVSWLFKQGVEPLWLTTSQGTRAQKFYQAAGWQLRRIEPNGEVRYELRASDAALPACG